MKYKSLVISSILLMLAQVAHAEQIGSVDTVFKMFGPDHKIVVEAFDDPDVTNVTCYVSRAKTGGIKGGLGLAGDTSACYCLFLPAGWAGRTERQNQER